MALISPGVQVTVIDESQYTPTAAGTIAYGGDCSSGVTSANAGLNTIVFNTLALGSHSNCTITVTNATGNVSNQLVVSPFVVGSPAVTTTSGGATATTNTSSATQLQALMAQLAQLQSQVSGGSTAAAGGTTTPSYNFTLFLKVGAKGAEVTALQQRLIKDGFLAAGSATGSYGALTEAAVKKFQSAHGIAAKGYIGPSTRTALNAGD